MRKNVFPHRQKNQDLDIVGKGLTPLLGLVDHRLYVMLNAHVVLGTSHIPRIAKIICDHTPPKSPAAIRCHPSMGLTGPPQQEDWSMRMSISSN